MNFAETVAGQRFLNHDFPSLVKSAERIAKAMEEQNKTAAKPYLLISVLDREITAEQFPSLEAAQAQMLAEIAQTGVADANILSISSAPVYDLLCLVENNASDDEDLSRAIRASRHIRNLFSDVEVIQKMRLSRQRTEQIVVDYLFENTDFR